MTSYLTPIRWREDTGWEYRCGDCAQKAAECFWPLTEEFWDRKRTMRRCRSCQKALDARNFRARYANDPGYRERQKAKGRRYHRETAHARSIYDQQRWQEVLAMDEVDRKAIRDKAAVRQRAYRARKRAAAGIEPKPEVVITDALERKRAKNREWMRAYRARRKAA